jgi:hypothetical protein
MIVYMRETLEDNTAQALHSYTAHVLSMYNNVHHHASCELYGEFYVCAWYTPIPAVKLVHPDKARSCRLAPAISSFLRDIEPASAGRSACYGGRL